MKKLLFLGLMFLSFNLFADAAMVLYVSDKVTASHGGATRALNRGSVLNAGDSITTSSTGYANIKYTNGTLVNLGPGTNYTILAYNPTKGAVQIKAALNSGSINSKTGGNTKEVLKTPVVALAILGTSYEVSVSGGKITKSKFHKHYRR